ncbi:hypothetical protein K461DRAFT_269230 [Myriangium duriaei CBS 260.36]|uniref:Uncharacterized protein n=1 Tax=Myriangium duriaei CBS 260.36 TaxID=1168546 RepID=A0A9P4MKL5_9PEZI|nr:hypothetical protein K461DRAFT_269230 [Myriangium duriaei CBS 260.36]
MLSFRLFFLAILMTTLGAAATKVTFLAAYRISARDIGHVSGSDDYSDTGVNYIENGIGDWSEYRYEAQRTRFNKLIITNTRPVANQDAANTLLNHMKDLCRQYT